jgi:plasmid stabilization system protein ParE
MSGYLISRAARTDLVGIWEYLADRNLVAADSMITKIRKSIELPSESPGLGHLRTDLTTRDVRFWPVQTYLVIYTENSPIEIVRVLSGFQDIVELLA